jgi:hypothetical protein
LRDLTGNRSLACDEEWKSQSNIRTFASSRDRNSFVISRTDADAVVERLQHLDKAANMRPADFWRQRSDQLDLGHRLLPCPVRSKHRDRIRDLVNANLVDLDPARVVQGSHVREHVITDRPSGRPPSRLAAAGSASLADDDLGQLWQTRLRQDDPCNEEPSQLGSAIHIPATRISRSVSLRFAAPTSGC